MVLRCHNLLREPLYFRAKPMRIKNWKRFQHFKDRKPPWIKLYRDLLDDIEWHELNGDTAKVLVMVWLIASETDEGQLPDIKELAFRLRLSEKATLQHVTRLSHWMLQDDIKMISEGYQDGSLETEGEKEKETKTEKKHPHGELGKVLLTEDEYKKLQSKHEPQKLSRAIEILDGYIAAKKPEYASHYAVFKADSWLWERLKELEGTTRDWRGDMSTVPTFEELRKEQQGGKR